jgi:plastocyanin
MVLIGACGASGGNERQVLVDYSTDDVTMFVAQNFPKKVSVVPGQTLVFKQTWNGEPHTVTGGKFATDKLREGSAWLDLFNGYDELRSDNPGMVNTDTEQFGDTTVAEFAAGIHGAKPVAKRDALLALWRSLRATRDWMPDLDNPPPATLFQEVNDRIGQEVEPIFNELVYAFDEEGNGLSQNVGQPCFLAKGLPPKDTNKACTKAQQVQPEFDGTQNFYNSGILRYEGAQGNTFRVKLANDAKPGTYYFYCAVHGPGQLTEVDIRKPGAKIPSASTVRREARDEAEAVARPLAKIYRDAVRTNRTKVEGKEVTGPFAGLPTPIHGSINEFVPRELHVKAGEPITWKIIGSDHTISFDVPPYLPIIQFGTKRVRLNPKVDEPSGGAPERPHGDEESDGPTKIDGGTYSGTGFWSSGLVGGGPYLEYTLRIAKPGTYPYACLLHPKMIGRVVVS